MSVVLPTPTQLRAVADQCGLSLTDEDVASFRGLMQGSVEAYNLVAAMPDEVPAVKYPRTPGYRPSPERTRTTPGTQVDVKGAASGKLKGKTVALKDNVMLAGVPMMNGSATLEGYVPDFDATIVTRMLDAGAEIVGKVSLRVLLHVRRQPHRRRWVRSTIRTRWAIRPAGRRRAAASSSRSARSTWRSAATRAARSACRPRSAASTA